MKRQRWLGGYVGREKSGAPVYVIEREIQGHRFHVSTRCNTERGALKQLERFEADPSGYTPEGTAEDPILLTEDLIIEFHRWSVAPHPNGRGNTEGHAREMTHRLTDWASKLRGVDLKRATLRDHIIPPLDGWRGRQHRIIAIKSLYAWLRKSRHLLTSGQDCTLDLPVPQARPEQYRRRKAVAFEVVQAAYGKLPEGPYRQVLQLLAATGMHVTELERFIRGGSLEQPARPVYAPDGQPVLGVLVVRHKSGAETRTPIVEAAHLEAAAALRAKGSVPRRLNATIKAACLAAGVPPFSAGVMRHSFATWGAQLGADDKTMSKFLGHTDPRTKDRFYRDMMIPAAAVPTRVLKLVPKVG